jgi:CRP-like cAMP-binding protein
VHSQATFKCKELLPLHPDTLWKIDKGVVRSLTWDEEGRIITLGFWGEGDVVGQPLSRMCPYQVECLTPVQASTCLPESPYVQHTLLVNAWQNEALLSIIHEPSVSDRLLRLLGWLVDRFGCSVPQGKLLALHLTHQNIAETIGTSRITVTRLMNQMERAGKLERVIKHPKSQRPGGSKAVLPRQSLILNQPR